MFTDYNNMATANLVDLLAQETQKFTQLMSESRFSQEYEDCKGTIHQIQAVIESRNGTTITDPSLAFTPPDTTAS